METGVQRTEVGGRGESVGALGLVGDELWLIEVSGSVVVFEGDEEWRHVLRGEPCQ